MTKRAAAVRRTPLRGIVTAIVAVTGSEDEVKDIIVPGAFANTLAKRRPKVAYMHDWKDPIGRVLSIHELKPGDKNLPKTLPDGTPWPKDAGAVVATMQFHLGTQRGREMFEHCREWAKNGEAAFSIGYRVPDGMSSRREDGVRLIYGLDLFEVSLVLHGAHPMALALEVKDARDAGEAPVEVKDAPVQTVHVEDDSIMVALLPDPDVAAQLAVDGGIDPADLHITLALPAGTHYDKAVEAVQRAAEGHSQLHGHIGGLGIFPPSPSSDGAVPIWRAVDVPGLVELRQDILAALAAAEMPHRSEHGFTPHMTIGYDLPSAAPVENVPASFFAVCVVRGSGERHHVRLTGGKKPDGGITGKAALAVYEARLVNSLVAGDAPAAAVLEAKMLTAATAGEAEVPGLGTAKRTPPRKKRAHTRKKDQEVPA